MVTGGHHFVAFGDAAKFGSFGGKGVASRNADEILFDFERIRLSWKVSVMAIPFEGANEKLRIISVWKVSSRGCCFLIY